MSWNQIFFDDFDNGVVDLLQDTPVGTITEAGGNLNFELTAGVNGNWWTGVYNAPIAYTTVIRGAKPIRITARVVGMTPGVQAAVGLTLFRNRQNFWLLDLPQEYVAKDLAVNRIVGGAVVSPIGVATCAAPATSPVQIRAVWNPVSNVVEGWSSPDDGVTWRRIGVARTGKGVFDDKDVNWVNVGLMLKSYATGGVGPACSASFDWLRIEEQDSPPEIAEGQFDGLEGHEEASRTTIDIDTTGGSFGTGAGHYGASRDGVYRYAGVACAPGAVALAGPALNWQAWQYPDVTQPLGYAAPGTVTAQAGGVARIEVATPQPSWNSTRFLSLGRWFLTGDFDIQIDFSNFTKTTAAGTEFNAGFSVHANFGTTPGQGDNSFRLERTYYAAGTQAHRASKIVDGTWTQIGEVAYSSASGKMRLVRVGNVATSYYWTGAAWALVATQSDFGAAPVAVNCWVDQNANGAGRVDYSAFTINSGAWTNLAGWAREAAGPNRGALASLPDTLRVAASPAGIDLTDRATSLLWARYVAAANNAVPWVSSNVIPRCLAYDSGLLLAAFGNNLSDTPDGGLLWIYFDLDYIRRLRTVAAGDSGRSYRRTGYAPDGCIAARNGGYGYVGGTSAVNTIPDLRVFGCDVWWDAASGYYYGAAATAGGLAVFRWKRWYLGSPTGQQRTNWVTSAVVTSCWFDKSTGDLYWIAGGVFRAARATWESPMVTTGTFQADESARHLLGSREVQHAVVVDVEAESSFGDPAADPTFYGIGADGLCRHGGEACVPGGPLSTPGGALNWLSWRYPDPAVPTGYSQPGTVTASGSNRIHFIVPVGATWNGTVVHSLAKWWLTGDFDITCEYENFTKTSAASGTEFLWALMVSRNFGSGAVGEFSLAVERTHYADNSHNVTCFKVVNGLWVSLATLPGHTETAGKFRITRVGSTLTGYYWTGSSWASLGSTTDIGADPLFVYLRCDQNLNGAGSVDAKNFTVVSGATTNLTAWATEAAGPHRGIQAAMPTRVLAVASAAALDLLDVTGVDPKLWMRFPYGLNNAVPWADSKVIPRHISYAAGGWQVAYSNEDGDTPNGALLIIGFNNDVPQWMRTTASGDSWQVSWRPGGRAISHRADGAGYVGGTSTLFVLPSLQVWGSDRWRDSEHVYIAVATRGGLTLFKTKPWYAGTVNFRCAWATSEAVRHCWFDRATGDLYWVGLTHLHRAPRSVWEAAFPTTGTFVASASLALPGTRTLAWNQWRPIQINSDVYLPANEGVYMSSAGAPFSLKYGSSGSGALVPRLPEHGGVVSLAHGVGSNRMILGLISPNRVVQLFTDTGEVRSGDELENSEVPLVVVI